jgi:hypothetical protein
VLLLDHAPSAAPEAPPARHAARLPIALLLALYVLLALLLDPRGGLGTDSGGKTATLEAMTQRGDWSLDVGYWAEAHDPDGELHPLWGTVRTDSGWVQVTTVPMLFAARPLYALGGARAALLVPMVGGVLAALAARALALSLGGGRRAATTAFWVVGAASPVLLYATDVWEHTWGLALMAWGAVLLAGRSASPPSPRAATAAGALFGVAATMRTEALVFAAAAALVLALDARIRAGARGAALGGFAAAAGFVVALYAVAESVLVGDTLRTARTGTTLVGSGAGIGPRVREGLATLVSIEGDGAAGILLGGLFVVAVAASVGAALAGDGSRAGLGAVLAGAVLAVRILVGPGFVPGLLTAAPLAVAGAVLAPRAPGARRAAVGVLLALPVVWATQLTGGAAPQWGGRYVLLAGLVLAVVGVVVLEDHRRLTTALVAGALVVTAHGAAWHVVRTHAVGEAFAVIAARPEPAVVFTEPFLPREAGAAAVGERWLAVGDAATLARAAEVVAAAGFDELLLVTMAGDARAWAPPAGWRASGAADTVQLLPGVRLELRTLVREGA